MSDYISRQAAFEALEKRGVSTTNISRVPIADVRENVRGEWISKIVECSRENYDQVFCCSVCGVSNDWRRTNFCPHCGADMRREMEKHFKKDKAEEDNERN